MNTNPQLQAVLSPGLLLVLSAPSGAGKTTLARMLTESFPQARSSVSFTTRPPRGQEKDGVDYHFVDTLTFQQMIEKNQFVEWAEVYGNFYGSSREIIDQAFTSRGIAVFDIDVQGGNAIKRKYPEAILIFIVPPSMDELERRLRQRATDSDDVIRRRMLASRSEVEKGVASYDYLIVNENLEDAFQRLSSIVLAEQSRRGRVDLSALKLPRD
jgi:guanylate kinase